MHRNKSYKASEDDSESSSDSSDSDSSKEDEQEQALIARVKQLENDLGDNKYLYDAHVELVQIYKTLGDLTSLREGYQRFHQLFPLTPNLWLDWINVEKSLATNPVEKELVFKLFDKAVEDYLSVDLWSEYAQYAIGATDLAKTRLILDRGINSAGLVCNGGALLWATYREIENLHISMYKEDSEERKQQLLKVADLFKRELSVPLLEMENSYAEWKQWIETVPHDLIDKKAVEYGYNKAKKVLETYKPFEDQLLTTETTAEYFEIIKNYIKIIKDPSTIICLYERAALQLCLVPEFWIEYCTYVFKLSDVILSVCKNALRNCPWSEDLWVLQLRIFEHFNKDESTIMKSFEEGISSIAPNPGLELWLTYLEYNRRCEASSEKLDKLFDQAIQQLGFEHDPQCKISRLYTRFLAGRGEMKKTRKIWGHILGKSSYKESANLWLEYANLEKQYGEQENLRQLFQRALNSVKDYPQYIIDEWLLYERHCGNLEDVIKCIKKCKEISVSFIPVIETSQQEASMQQINTASLGKGKKRKLGQEEASRGVKRFREIQPKNEQQEFKKPQVPLDKNPLTTVFISNLLPGVGEGKLKSIFPNAVNLEIARDRRGKSRCFGYVQFKTQEEVMVALARDREPLNERPIFISEVKTERTAEKKPSVFKYATDEEKNKLFIRGLPIKKTKEEIEEIFKKYGVKQVRLVLHKSGQPKGLAYVEFENEIQAQQAMKETDQMIVDEHVITVVVSAPPPKAEKSRFLYDNNKKDEPIRHPRNRLQTSLIPRSVQVSTSAKDDQMRDSKEKAQNNKDAEKVPQNEEEGSKKAETQNGDQKKSMSDSELELDSDISTYSDIPVEVASNADNNIIIPPKSKILYERAYQKFIAWCNEKNIKTYSEHVLMAYFSHLVKIYKFKSSTLYSNYSMLKAQLIRKHNIWISTYAKLLGFLKQQDKDYTPKKSSTFTKEQIDFFLNQAPDKQFLAIKVILIFGVSGACRCDELVRLKTSDIEDFNSMLLVTIINNNNTNNTANRFRTFSIVGERYLNIIRKYSNLRPDNYDKETRYFIKYAKGRCHRKVLGIHAIDSVPRKVAVYLKLDDLQLYTGHSLRRTSKTLLVDASGNLTSLERPNGRKSTRTNIKVAPKSSSLTAEENYINNDESDELLSMMNIKNEIWLEDEIKIESHDVNVKPEYDVYVDSSDGMLIFNENQNDIVEEAKV